ncbi:MAG: glycosyltransferase, partial [Actinomycetota bacterium]
GRRRPRHQAPVSALTRARVWKVDTSGRPRRRIDAEAAVIGCSDAILASSEAEANQIRTLYGAAPDRIEIVAPGVDHAFFSPGDQAGARAATGLGPGPVLLFVGRIQPLKGLDVAVRALADLDRPGATLVVVGGPSGVDGDGELARVRALADRLGVAEQIRWIEPQPHTLLSTWYRAADVCLVPSRSESFGLVALEAAACGVPVVAAAVGGLRSIVQHGRTGFLVEGRDPAVFASYVDEILDAPEVASSFSAAAADRAAGYTWSTTAARLRRLYGDVVARAPVAC